MRRAARVAALALTLLLLASACGQKAGVARLTAGAAGSGTGVAAGEETFEGGVEGTAGGDTALAPGEPAAPGVVTVPGGAPQAPTGTRPVAGGTAGTPRPGTTGGGGPAASGPEDRTGISATAVKIGIHAPITGAAAVSTFEAGVGVYSRHVGKIPGLGNREIQVVYKDDKFDTSAARAACRALVEEEKVFLLIGGAGADQIETCAQYAQSKGVPYFSAGVTEGGFKGLTQYFALSETYNQQNVQLAQYIRNKIDRPKKLGILLTDSPLLEETEKSMKAAAASAGIDVVYTGKIRKDGNKGDTDAQVSQLKGKAEIVYALIPPTVFAFLIQSAKEQQYMPVYVGPGLSNGLNLVAKAICSPPFPTVQYLSPMIQMDKIDQNDPDYKTAYRAKNGTASQPDDIGILLWGLEKTIRMMLESVGPTISRQSLVSALESGKSYSTNVYAPVKFGGAPHFGANQTTLLTLNCGRLEFDTTTAFVSDF